MWRMMPRRSLELNKKMRTATLRRFYLNCGEIDGLGTI